MQFCPGSVSAPGVIGAVSRRVASVVETLVLCDNAHGACSPAYGRGFYRLCGAGKYEQTSLGPKLSTYEVVPGTTALRPYEITSFLSCATFCADSGLTFFTEGHAVMTLDANNVVRLLAGDRCEPTAQASDAQFSYPSELAAPEPGVLFVTDSQGLHQIQLAPLGDGSGVVSSGVTTLRWHDEDRLGQLSIACMAGCLVLSSATAIYRQWNMDRGLSVECSTFWRPWAGEEGSRGTADGCGCDARFSSITAVGIDGNGTAVLVDALADGKTSVRCVNEDGDVKTVLTPAVAGSSCSSQSTYSCDRSYMAVGCSPDDFGAEAVDQVSDGASIGGGLRCPLVPADDVLLLCAPLQDALVLMHVPGLCADPGLHSTSRVRNACSTTTSNPTVPAGCVGDDGCRGTCFTSPLSHSAASSCGSNNSLAGGAVVKGVVSTNSSGNNQGFESQGPIVTTSPCKAALRWCESEEDDACSRVHVDAGRDWVKQQPLPAGLEQNGVVLKSRTPKRRRSL